MVGQYHAESTHQYTAGDGITTKIPTFYCGSTSWFKYEEFIDDWLDLKVLEAEKRGPALKNWLVGDADMYKGLLDRESLRVADGVKYFRDAQRPHVIKGAQSVFLWTLCQFTRARRGNVENVKWIGQISLLLKRLKDSWMDMLPMSALSVEQRQNQYLADVAQENAERQTRSETALDPNAPATRERWNAAQVSNHKSLLPFSDNLTTLMFTVASDLSEAQREWNSQVNSLSLLRMDITACTFEAVWTVFVVLFCTPKSSMENPSLRVSGHVSSMNRTFIVEDDAEDEFGQWAKGEVTGEQSYVDDERSCFWTWDDTQCACLGVQTIQGPPGEKKKRKGKRKRQRTIQKDQKSILWWWASARSRMVARNDKVWWSKGKKGKKACQKAMMASMRVGFRLYQPDKGASKDYTQNKGKRKDKKGKGKEGTFPQSRLSVSENIQRRIWPGLGIRRLVSQSRDWRFLDSRCWVVLHKGSYCMDGGDSV